MNIISKLFSPVRWFLKTSLLKKIIVIIILGVIIFFGWGFISARNNKPAYTTGTVKKETIIDTVTESGNIQSNQLNVYSSSNGVIEKLLVKNGDSVTKGDTLFQVKSTASDQEKASAYASYAQSLSSLSTAQNNLKSQQSGLDKVLDDIHLFQYGNGGLSNIGSANETQAQKTQREQSQASVRSATDAVTSADASVQSASLSYQATQDANVTAQVSGVIANLSYGVGDQVTAAAATSNTGTTASPILVIGTATDDVVKIQINEVDINKIKNEQNAKITIDAIKDKTFTGTVTRVDQYGTNTSGVITYNVYIKINDPDQNIKPLMSATVTIETETHNDALVVPNNAVKPYKGGKAIQVLDTSKPGNQLKYITVKTGIKSSTETEILSGVTEGETIVTSASATTTTKSSGGGLGGPPGG